MRFGIAMPGTGPLARPAVVEATARAAFELGYASVWSRSTRQLMAVVAQVEQLPVGWLATDSLGGQRLSPLGAERLETTTILSLGSRLRYVAAPESELAALREVLPGCLLLDTSDDPPTRAVADGWSPHWDAGEAAGGLLRSDRPSGLVILRISGAPTDDELRDALTARVDELIVALPAAVTMDEQLAGFADIAERVATQLQSAC